jgi:hypothetical protein
MSTRLTIEEKARRGGNFRRRSLAIFATGLAAVAGGWVVAQPAATQAPAVSRGTGDMAADTPRDPTPAPGPGQPPRVCSYFHITGTSRTYSGTYGVTDANGVQHTYDGPLTVTVAVDIYENPQGSFTDSACLVPGGAPIKSASLRGASGGKSVSCSGYSGSYTRTGGFKILIDLKGSCQITDGGVTYTARTDERRVGTLTNSTPESDGQGRPIRIEWIENYVATTTCIQPVPCKPPAADNDPGTKNSTTTTAKQTGTTLAALGPPGGGGGGSGQAGGPPPGGAGPAGGPGSAGGPGQAGGPGSAGFSGFSVPGSGVGTPAGPGTLGGLGTSVSSSSAASQVLAPGSASAPGSAATAARSPAVLPATGVVPERQAAPQHAMVAHQASQPFPGPAVAAGAGLWLGFVCLVCVKGRRPSLRWGDFTPAPALSTSGCVGPRPGRG